MALMCVFWAFLRLVLPQARTQLPFMLNLRKLPPPQGDFALGSRQVDLDTSRLMMSYFISFAASGDPNTHIKDIADAPRWPAYNEAQEELVFERKSHAARTSSLYFGLSLA